MNGPSSLKLVSFLNSTLPMNRFEVIQNATSSVLFCPPQNSAKRLALDTIPPTEPPSPPTSMPSSHSRVTMKDVARALQLDISTVSLALKGDSRLKDSTKAKVRECATRMGYVPDPLLSALSNYRRADNPGPVSATLAFLCPYNEQQLRLGHSHFELWEGARDRAFELGYRLERYTIDNNPIHMRRQEKILAARGVTGLIYAPVFGMAEKFSLHWDQYCIVCIEGHYMNMSVHRVSTDQSMITREAIEQLDRKGYRRIGLAVGYKEEKSLRYAFSSGYHLEMALRPRLVPIPPFYLEETRDAFHPSFLEWVRKHQIEVVISNWIKTDRALEERRRQGQTECLTVGLDLFSREGAKVGMQQKTRLVGARALEQLTMLIKTSQRGLIDTPNSVLIPGVWVDGDELPDKASR